MPATENEPYDTHELGLGLAAPHEELLGFVLAETELLEHLLGGTIRELDDGLLLVRRDRHGRHRYTLFRRRTSI